MDTLCHPFYQSLFKRGKPENSGGNCKTEFPHTLNTLHTCLKFAKGPFGPGEWVAWPRQKFCPVIAQAYMWCTMCNRSSTRSHVPQPPRARPRGLSELSESYTALLYTYRARRCDKHETAYAHPAQTVYMHANIWATTGATPTLPRPYPSARAPVALSAGPIWPSHQASRPVASNLTTSPPMRRLPHR